jgi:polygalacturonase
VPAGVFVAGSLHLKSDITRRLLPGAARRLENVLKRQKGDARFYRITGLERIPGS